MRFTAVTTFCLGALLCLQSAGGFGVDFSTDGQYYDGYSNGNNQYNYQAPQVHHSCQLGLFGGIGNAINAVGAGIGAGLSGLATGLGKGIADIGTGIGLGITGVAKGLGMGLGFLGQGLGQCLLDVGHGLGWTIAGLFHGCHWHVGGRNRGVISIGLPGHVNLMANHRDGPHITYSSSFANGNGALTFYFTYASNGRVDSDQSFSKSYPLTTGEPAEIQHLIQRFLSVCRGRGHRSPPPPSSSGKINWETTSSNGQLCIHLEYTQERVDAEPIYKHKTYRLHSGDQEEVKNAIAEFKRQLQAGEI